jgi:Domain of unknown function (DUF1993)/Protein of unknown function (DUF1643)
VVAGERGYRYELRHVWDDTLPPYVSGMLNPSTADDKIGDAMITRNIRALPNFHFHAATAYDILRSRGVPLGKRDYEGQLRTRSTSPKSDSATHG